jgi:CBS domain-containing protein
VPQVRTEGRSEIKASDVMARHVVTVEPDAPIAKAVRLMLQNRISGLPVVDGKGKLVGIVTEGDFLRRTETGTELMRRRHWLEFLLGPGPLAKEYVRTRARRVDEVMTPDVVTVDEDAPVNEIVRRMEQRGIKRVPVVREGLVVGIVSRINLLHALAAVLGEAPAVPVEDTVLRERVLAEIEKQNWAPRIGIDVSVHNGVVELWGTILDERVRLAFRVAAENVPGVKAVQDHLCWVEPLSSMVIEAPAGAARRRL